MYNYQGYAVFKINDYQYSTHELKSEPVHFRYMVCSVLIHKENEEFLK